MKKLFRFIYRSVVSDIHKEVEKSRVKGINKVMNRWNLALRSSERRKWDYSVMQAGLARNNEVHKQLLEEKLAKWEWLRKLG